MIDKLPSDENLQHLNQLSHIIWESSTQRLNLLVSCKGHQISEILKSVKLHLPHLLFQPIFGILKGDLAISDAFL